MSVRLMAILATAVLMSFCLVILSSAQEPKKYPGMSDEAYKALVNSTKELPKEASKKFWGSIENAFTKAWGKVRTEASKLGNKLSVIFDPNRNKTLPAPEASESNGSTSSPGPLTTLTAPEASESNGATSNPGPLTTRTAPEASESNGSTSNPETLTTLKDAEVSESNGSMPNTGSLTTPVPSVTQMG